MTPLSADRREQFDVLLEQVLAELPAGLRARFDEIPLVVEDRPSPQMLRKLGIEPGQILQGVHSGIPLTRRSVLHSGTMPTVITIYREGIMTATADAQGRIADEPLRHAIRTTILHELGHHFGLGEDELRRYGYG